MRRVPQRHQYRFRQPECRECKWSLRRLSGAAVRRRLLDGDTAVITESSPVQSSSQAATLLGRTL
jgi:hypothetical protein